MRQYDEILDGLKKVQASVGMEFEKYFVIFFGHSEFHDRSYLFLGGNDQRVYFGKFAMKEDHTSCLFIKWHTGYQLLRFSFQTLESGYDETCLKHGLKHALEDFDRIYREKRFFHEGFSLPIGLGDKSGLSLVKPGFDQVELYDLRWDQLVKFFETMGFEFDPMPLGI